MRRSGATRIEFTTGSGSVSGASGRTAGQRGARTRGTVSAADGARSGAVTPDRAMAPMILPPPPPWLPRFLKALPVRSWPPHAPTHRPAGPIRTRNLCAATNRRRSRGSVCLCGASPAPQVRATPRAAESVASSVVTTRIVPHPSPASSTSAAAAAMTRVCDDSFAGDRPIAAAAASRIAGARSPITSTTDGIDVEPVQRVERLDLHVGLFNQGHGQRPQIREIAAGDDRIDRMPLLPDRLDAVAKLRREMGDQRVPLKQFFTCGRARPVLPLEFFRKYQLPIADDRDRRAVPVQRQPRRSGPSGRARPLPREQRERLRRREHLVDTKPGLPERREHRIGSGILDGCRWVPSPGDHAGARREPHLSPDPRKVVPELDLWPARLLRLQTVYRRHGRPGFALSGAYEHARARPQLDAGYRAHVTKSVPQENALCLGNYLLTHG